LVRRILGAAAINILSKPPALLRKAGRGGSIAVAVLHSRADFSNFIKLKRNCFDY
jgi:hypothetical protein